MVECNSVVRHVVVGMISLLGCGVMWKCNYSHIIASLLVGLLRAIMC